MNRRLTLAALVVATFAAATAQGQTAVAIAPNADVRATMTSGPQRRIDGQFVRLTADTLHLSRHRATIALPVAQVQRLQVRGARNPWRGARWGAGLLGGIAVVFGGIDAANGTLGGGEYIGTIIGNSIIGGLLGYAIAPRGWEDVPRHLLGSGGQRP